MLHDVVTIILSWLLFFVTSAVSAPIVFRTIGKHLPDAGWGLTRAIGWLFIATPIWFLAHLSLPVNSTAGIWILTIALIGFSAYLFKKNQTTLLEQFEKAKPFILVEEVLFVIGVLFMMFMRGYQPDINGLEKFMDVGLMNTYLHSPTLPIPDMWLAGYNFNYYTFGHYLGAVATQLIRQPIDISYNVILALLMGIFLTQAFSFITLIQKGFVSSQKITLATSVIGSLLVVLGGNTQHIWYWLKNRSFEGYWYPDATRFIPNTIHEFPAYSFIVSDLHAHVWGITLVLLMLPLAFIWSKVVLATKKPLTALSDENPLLWSIPIGILLGLMASTSTWDTLIYGMMIGIIGISLALYSKFKLFKRLALSAVVMILSLMVSASPWFLNFDSISEGARLVTERSELWRLLALWITHVAASATVLFIAVKMLKKNQSKKLSHTSLFLIGLVATAWILLILPEIFYMKDIYPGHPRANTMFKLTFQAFILMSALYGWLLGFVSSLNFSKPYQKLVVAFPFLMAGILLIYPYFGFRDYYNLKFGSYQSLDGLTWLAKQHPSDYAGIQWLRRNVRDHAVILEAVGESYTTFSRVSTFTNLSTVLGWPVHEWLWRGSFDIPGQRTGEVQAMYEEPLSEASRIKLKEYGVAYIFVGDKEREAYPNINEQALKQLGEIIFSQGETYIIQITTASPSQSRVQ